jgi:hypothetical protein
MVVRTGHTLETHSTHHDIYGKYEQTGTSIYMHVQTPPPSHPPTRIGLTSQHRVQPHASQRHLHCTSGIVAGASGCTDRAKRPHAMHEGCWVASINFIFQLPRTVPHFGATVYGGSVAPPLQRTQVPRSDAVFSVFLYAYCSTCWVAGASVVVRRPPLVNPDVRASLCLVSGCSLVGSLEHQWASHSAAED